jgi:hypothetical protein
MGGLAHWYAATRSTPFAPGTLEAMRAAPNFRAALHCVARDTLGQYEADKEMSRTLNDSARMNMGFFALYLDASGGLTLARIQALMADLGFSSRGRAAAFLIRLRMLGFVEVAAVQPDRRARVYLPTQKLRSIILTQLRTGFSALSLIEPEAAALPAIVEQPAVFQRLMRDIGGGFIKSVKVSPAPPLLQTFTRYNLGMMIVFTLLLSAPDGSFPPVGPIPVSVAGMARRYGLSRSHVQRLFRAGEKGGFFSHDPNAGTVTLHPTLFDSIEQFYAFYFSALAACAYAVLNDTPEQLAQEEAMPVAVG